MTTISCYGTNIIQQTMPPYAFPFCLPSHDHAPILQVIPSVVGVSVGAEVWAGAGAGAGERELRGTAGDEEDEEEEGGAVYDEEAL